ncbi:MAG: hypothetical protein SFT92_03030 [Rickettsiales bacterium]|nr:hypothetical protein [Rickettsiales bacterium]
MMGWRSVLGLKEKPEGVTFDPPSHLAANTDPVKPASSAYRAEKNP